MRDRSWILDLINVLVFVVGFTAAVVVTTNL